VGRTGRAGASGKAYVFFTPDDSRSIADLIDVLNLTNQKIPEELEQMQSMDTCSHKCLISFLQQQQKLEKQLELQQHNNKSLNNN